MGSVKDLEASRAQRGSTSPRIPKDSTSGEKFSPRYSGTSANSLANNESSSNANIQNRTSNLNTKTSAPNFPNPIKEEDGNSSFRDGGEGRGSAEKGKKKGRNTKGGQKGQKA